MVRALAGTEMYLLMWNSCNAAGDADELRHDVAEVDDDQQQHQDEGHAQAELFADEIAQALAGDGSHAGTHFLHHQQGDGDGDHGP